MGNYYALLIGIILSISLIQIAYEIRLITKLKNKNKCSYCGLHLTDQFKMSLPFPGIPLNFKCKRWWCDFFKYLGYLTPKKLDNKKE